MRRILEVIGYSEEVEGQVVTVSRCVTASKTGIHEQEGSADVRCGLNANGAVKAWRTR